MQVSDHQALEALDFDWGEAYEIAGTGLAWRARRRDGLGGEIEARDPEALRKLIRDDYTLRPVPRECAP